MRLRSFVWLGLSLLATAPHAAAQVELGQALQLLQRSGTRTLPRSFARAANHRIAVLAEYPQDSGLSDFLVGGRYRPLWLAPTDVAPFIADHPEVKLHWSPPRHVLMDQAARWIFAKEFRAETGYTGKGVVVGIVDTGLDVAHHDLRNADGTSRVRYFLAFSRPAGD